MTSGSGSVHPGEILREDILPALGNNKTKFAMALGISRQHLHRLLNEEVSVTFDLAARLGKVCGNGPRFWVNLQAAYDVDLAENIDVSALSTLEEV